MTVELSFATICASITFIIVYLACLTYKEVKRKVEQKQLEKECRDKQEQTDELLINWKTYSRNVCKYYVTHSNSDLPIEFLQTPGPDNFMHVYVSSGSRVASQYYDFFRNRNI